MESLKGKIIAGSSFEFGVPEDRRISIFLQFTDGTTLNLVGIEEVSYESLPPGHPDWARERERKFKPKRKFTTTTRKT